MSKSKNNGIDPQVMVERYGATVRLCRDVRFSGGYDLEWQDWRRRRKTALLNASEVDDEHTAKRPVAALNVDALSEDRALRRDVHKTIAKVTDDIAAVRCSTPPLRRS
ncbi:hypothetical protein KCP70_19515 [Salmonella enterica subsp. enterica]|nr:hypothetical protein KCP70_19515 [Salmonella enterica subsp. enterica]